MSRSFKKGFYVHPKIAKKIAAMVQSGDKKVVKIRDRSSQIMPDMLGFTFAVHNGKQFVSVYVTEDMS